MRTSRTILIPMTLAAALAAPGWANACAACFSRSDAPMAQGVNAGIFVLLGVIGTVLIGAGSFFIFLARKSAAVMRAEAAAKAMTNQPTT